MSKPRLTVLTSISWPEPPAAPAFPTFTKPLWVHVPPIQSHSKGRTVIVTPESVNVPPTLCTVPSGGSSKSIQLVSTSGVGVGVGISVLVGVFVGVAVSGDVQALSQIVPRANNPRTH
jgi:hypothetical protein